jgi:transposase InsO family protein
MSRRWHLDLDAFVLPRENKDVYLVMLIDEASRFVVGFGLYPRITVTLVLKLLRSALASHGAPREILLNRGFLYVAQQWQRRLHEELEKHGIALVVARPWRPQGIGMCERFWTKVLRECLVRPVSLDLAHTRRRLASFIGDYNHHRGHRPLGGLAPAARFYGAAQPCNPSAVSESTAEAAASAQSAADGSKEVDDE